MDGVTSTTAELNILDGVTSTAAELNILDGVTSTAAELNILDGVTSTAAELNLLDGVTATTNELNILDGVTASAGDINLIDGITNGTVIASKAIITDANKDITGGRNITISGELDAATLDISGDADIDGTLEADAITIGGITLAETISDTVGAMVSSNTETNITVTYDDADNTLDFVIGTLNQDTTGNAATATALETARTIHGVSFDGTANIDLSEVIADTVGAMVSSNTETNITVAYQDDDNTLDFTIGTLNQDTTGNAATATALETARTIGGVSFNGTANIVPTTFNAATFSGDLNVDSGVLFADVSTNRVGINQTTPDVSLDLGANTDAVHVPVGTTAQRPGSPAAGYFRYNTTTSGFEGYTDSWGSIGGGGTAPILNTMTGDGSDTTLTLTSAPVNENATVVTIDGVLQHKDTYSISGTTLTFSEAPPTGTAVECITWVNTTVSSALLLEDADGDTKVQVEESSDEDKIRFDTGGTERMIIDSSGIDVTGTVTSDGLTVEAGIAQLQLIDTGVSGSTKLRTANAQTWLEIDPDNVQASSGFATYIDGKRFFNIADTGDISFYDDTGTSQALYWDASAESLGIGTTSPTSPLTVKSSSVSSAASGISIQANGNTNNIISMGEKSTDGGRFHMYDGGVEKIAFYTDGTANHISAGNVGIGTDSPSTLLHLSAANDPIITLTDTGFGASADITGSNGNLRLNSQTATIFDMADSEVARIDSSGNLLVSHTGSVYNNINTTSTVGSSYTVNGEIFACSDQSSGVMILNRKSSDGDIATFKKDGSTVGSIGVVSSNNLKIHSTSSGHSGLSFGTGIVYATDNSGDATNGATDLGSSSYTWKDIYLGGGAYLGGTGSANKLDDYEEGTYSPTITPATSGSVTINSYTKYAYTKVGRLVTITGIIRSDSQSSPQGDARISLPFTVANLDSLSGRSFGTVKIGGLSWGTSGYLVAEMIEGDDYFTITVCEDNGGSSTLNSNLFASGIDTVSVGFQYFTDA
jgi:hypothetical protein